MKRKVFIKITDILIRSLVASLAALFVAGWLFLVFGFISGVIEPPSFGIYR